MDEGRRWNQFRSYPLPAISTMAGFRVSQSDAVDLHPYYSLFGGCHLPREGGVRAGGLVGDPVTVWGYGGDLVPNGMAVADGFATIRVRLVVT